MSTFTFTFYNGDSSFFSSKDNSSFSFTVFDLDIATMGWVNINPDGKEEESSAAEIDEKQVMKTVAQTFKDEVMGNIRESIESAVAEL